MSDKAIRKLALEWLSDPTTEIYGRQLMWAFIEVPTLWEKFEKEEQIEKMRQQVKDNDEY